MSGWVDFLQRLLTTIHPVALVVVIVVVAIHDFQKAVARVVERWLNG